jgi:hypothetical protein
VSLPPADGRASILAAAGRRTPMAPGVMQQAQELVRCVLCRAVQRCAALSAFPVLYSGPTLASVLKGVGHTV